MTSARYMELSGDMDLSLTPEEFAAGWHFCNDWDGLLIHASDPEAEACLCARPRPGPAWLRAFTQPRKEQPQPEEAAADEESLLPAERQVISGRTFDRPWNAAQNGAAIEKPAPRRLRDVMFGLAMAFIVALVLYAVWRGWVFGGVPR